MEDTSREPEQSLTAAERDGLLQDLDRDGFIVLPQLLPQWAIDEVNLVLDRIIEDDRRFYPSASVFYRYNIVELDPMFRWLMMYKPALQLVYDCLGPEFVLSQDQFAVKYAGPDTPAAKIGWHSDGPANFPLVDGRCPLHTLRFGYLFSDATAQDSGSIDVVRGSHKNKTTWARETLHWQPPVFVERELSEDVVGIRGRAGTVYAFHNGIWHSAQPNRTAIARRIAYLQYTPSWMRPHHRNDPSMYDLQLYTAEERWLLGEPRRANSWMVGDEHDHQRLARFSRGAE